MSSDGHPGSSSSNPVRDDETEGSPSKRPRSHRSSKHAFVRFWNKTQSRRMRVIWMNYQGKGIKYPAVEPRQFLDVNTFETHPWVFQDADTGDKMVAMGKEVFEPVAYNIREQGWPPQRTEVTVDEQVHSLQRLCVQVLKDVISPDKLETANIPLVWKEEIRQAIESDTE